MKKTVILVSALLLSALVHTTASCSSDSEVSATCLMACHVYAECSGCDYADKDKAIDSCQSMCEDFRADMEQTAIDEAEACAECINAELGDSCDMSIMEESDGPCSDQCSGDGVTAFQQQWSDKLQAEDDERYEDFKCQGCSGSSGDMESTISYSCTEMANSVGKCVCDEGPQQNKEFDFDNPCFKDSAEEQLLAECE